MSKVAANEGPREECSCGAKLIRARNEGNRSTVLLEQLTGYVGTWGLELPLVPGELPTARRIGRGTRYKVHVCKLMKVRY